MGGTKTQGNDASDGNVDTIKAIGMHSVCVCVWETNQVSENSWVHDLQLIVDMDSKESEWLYKTEGTGEETKAEE